MIQYAILITMLFSSQPEQFGDMDAVRINSLDGKPLMFQSINDCDQHVQENINPLKRYAISVYSAADPLVRVKDILCVEVRGVGV